jgi:hypothetical protein
VYAQRRSAAVSRFRLIGQVAAGTRFVAAGTGLGCSVYGAARTVNVACFKLGTKSILNRSYAVALGVAGVQVSRFEDGKATTVFVGTP